MRFFGFWLCLNVFSIEKNQYFFDWVSTFSFAWIVGLIVPSAPGGVGIFESSILISSSIVPQELMLLVLLLAQIKLKELYPPYLEMNQIANYMGYY